MHPGVAFHTPPLLVSYTFSSYIFKFLKKLYVKLYIYITRHQIHSYTFVSVSAANLLQKEKQGFGICSQKLVSCSNTLSKSSEKHI